MLMSWTLVAWDWEIVGVGVDWYGHMEPLLLAYSKTAKELTYNDSTGEYVFHYNIVDYADDDTLTLTFREG